MPDLIERGQDTLLSCPMYSAGALVAPSAGTVTVYDASGAEIVSGAAVTVAASVATYTMLAAATASLSPAEGWRVQWSLTMGGDTETPHNDAALVRARLYPPATDADLYRLESSLDPAGSACIHSRDDFQDALDESWAQIQAKLIAKGNRPNLVMSPASFRYVHIYNTLHLVFRDFATRLDESWALKQEDYKREFREAWDDLNFLYDSGDTGDGADPSKRRSSVPTMWLGSRGRSWRR